MPESELFEVEIRVSRPRQQDAVIHREYQSVDAASTDKAAREIADGLEQACGERLRVVNDGR